MTPAEDHGYVHPQQAARLGVELRNGGFRLVDIGQDQAAAFIIGAALLGRPQAAGRPIEQARAEPVLQARNLFADSGRGQVHLPGGGGETAGINRFDE
jgi:hypothetical protein